MDNNENNGGKIFTDIFAISIGKRRKVWYNRYIANEPFSLKGVLLNDKQADGNENNRFI